MALFELERSQLEMVSALPNSGWVEALLEGGLMRVICRHQAIVCRKAIGCLLQPCEGDRVALHAVEDDIHYVMAVLERPTGQPARLGFDRQLSIEAAGSVELCSQSAVALRSGGTLQLEGQQLEAAVASAELAATRVDAWLGQVEVRAGVVRTIAKAVDCVADRLVQVLKHSFRSTSGVDQVRASQLDIRASGQLTLHARNTLLTAEQLAKIDADQIHLG